MSVLQRVALYSNERLDLPDARSLEAYGLNDWLFFGQGILSGDSLVVSGFDISNYSQAFTGVTFKVKQSNVALLHPDATTQAAGFYVSAGSEIDKTISFSTNTTSFVEVDLTTESGTSDIRSFWDPGANAGAGGEYTDTVNTVINLLLNISVNVTGFTAGKIPLYKVVTNGTQITSITDSRPMFFRLGSGGNTPDPFGTYSFPSLPSAAQSRQENNPTSTSYVANNEPFQGGDKNIKTLKNWMDAVMTVLKEIKGTPYWYTASGGSGSSVVNAYQNAALTILMGGTWSHLGIGANVLSSTATTVTVVDDAAFVAGPSSFVIDGTTYTYTAYSSSLKKFTGVSPSATGLTTDKVVKQGSFGHIAIADGSTIYMMGKTNNNSIPAIADIDLNTYPNLYIMTPSTDTSVIHGYGQDGLTPVVPKLVTGFSASTVTVGIGGNYPIGGGTILIRGIEFTYTTYVTATGLFSGLSSDPSAVAQVGDTVYIVPTGAVGYLQQSIRSQVPGQSGTVSEGAERTFWLAVYDGSSKMRIREGDLQIGEQIQVGDNSTQNIITYIGSSGEADSTPLYNVNSIPNGTNLTDAITTAFEIIETPIYDETVTVDVNTLATNQPVGSPVAGLQSINSYGVLSENIATGTGYLNIAGSGTAQKKRGIKITVTGSTYVSSFLASLYKTGTVSGNLIANIYNDTGGLPSSFVAASTTVLASSLPTSDPLTLNATFDFSTTLSAGTYHVVIEGDATFNSSTDASNYVTVTGSLNINNDARGTVYSTSLASYIYESINNQALKHRLTTQIRIVAQQFVTTSSSKLTNGSIKLKKTGSPDAYIYIDVYTNSAGNPGTLIATSDLLGSDILTTSFADYDFYFPSVPTLAAGTYWFIVRPKISPYPYLLDIDNYVDVGLDSSGLYTSNSAYSLNNGTSWTTDVSVDFFFTLQSQYGLGISDVTSLPVNAKTSMPQTYEGGTDELVVYVNGELMEPGQDYTEGFGTSSSITWLKQVKANSRIRLRIGNVGGASATSSNTSLQAAYNNGASITTATGVPVTINGTAGDKLLSVLGDMYLQGILDPAGVEFTPQAVDPFAGAQIGIYAGADNKLKFRKDNGTILEAQAVIETMGGQNQQFTRTMTNTTGVTIPANTPVYIISNNHIAPCDATDPVKSRFFGITLASIPHNSSGAVCYSGIAVGVLTAITDGSYLYISTTPGAYSTSGPGTGNYETIMGISNGNDLILQVTSRGLV